MNNIQNWWIALRPFTYTVSVFPPIIGTILAAYSITFQMISWVNFVVCLIGCVIVHAGSNLLSDYFDFKKGVDSNEIYGARKVLVEKLLTPNEVLTGAICAYGVAAIIGAYFVFSIPNGYNLVWLIGLGGILGIFYTAGPYEIKYHALGDIAVFIAFGSAMSLGAYFVQTGEYSWPAALYIIPLGLLVDSILHSNNIRDAKHDSEVGANTLVVLIGENFARVLYYIMVVGSYILTAIFVLLINMPVYSLLVFLSLPIAYTNIRTVRMKNEMLPEQFAIIDAESAKLHSLFALLLVIGLTIHYFLPFHGLTGLDF